MIPRTDIYAWREYAPWQTNEQIEQDLVISRFLVELFNDDYLNENLAFRGGTAIHKIYLAPAARYSEDIDLVQIKPGPIGHIFDRLKKISFIQGKIKREQKKMNSRLIFSFDSEISPVIPLKLKIEINCREHVPAFTIASVPFEVNTKWFQGKCKVRIYTLEELLGTKIRALYQRKKGRDLFDLWYALIKAKPEPHSIIKAFKSYMSFTNLKVSKTQLINNVESKLQDTSFTHDMPTLIRSGIKYDIIQAWQIVKSTLIDKL